VAHFVWMTSIMALGNMSGLVWWGRLVDAHGSRPALTISLVLGAALGLAWLGLPADPFWIAVWAAAVYFVWGVLEGGLQMGSSQAMIAAVPERYQAEGFAIAIYASAVGGVLGGLAGGAAFQAAGGLAIAGFDLQLLYLAIAQLGMLITWLLSRHLSGHARQTPVRELIHRARKRVRSAAD